MEYYTDKGRDGQDKQEKTCCKTQHVKIDMKRDASIIICRMAAVGENYKLTRDSHIYNFCKQLVNVMELSEEEWKTEVTN